MLSDLRRYTHLGATGNFRAAPLAVRVIALTAIRDMAEFLPHIHVSVSDKSPLPNLEGDRKLVGGGVPTPALQWPSERGLRRTLGTGRGTASEPPIPAKRLRHHGVGDARCCSQPRARPLQDDPSAVLSGSLRSLWLERLADEYSA